MYISNHTSLKLLYIITTTLLLGFYQIDTANADCNVSASWLPNLESNLAGYKILYGNSDGGPYTNVVDVGKPAAVNERVYGNIPSLICGDQYYAVSVAYNYDGIEGNYSNQIAFVTYKETINTTPPVLSIPNPPELLIVE